MRYLCLVTLLCMFIGANAQLDSVQIRKIDDMMGPTTAQGDICTQAIVGIWAAIFEQMNIDALPTITFGIERELVLGVGL